MPLAPVVVEHIARLGLSLSDKNGLCDPMATVPSDPQPDFRDSPGDLEFLLLLIVHGKTEPIGKFWFLGSCQLELVAAHTVVGVLVELELVDKAFLGFPLEILGLAIPIVFRKRWADFPDAPLIEVWQHHIQLHSVKGHLNAVNRFLLLHAEVHLN